MVYFSGVITSKHSSTFSINSDSTQSVTWVCFESVCVSCSFCLILGAFLYCSHSPYILAVCFIHYLASSVRSCGPFNDIISNAFRASFFRVLLLFVLKHFIALPPLSSQAELIVMMWATLVNKLMIGYTSQFIVAQIC